MSRGLVAVMPAYNQAQYLAEAVASVIDQVDALVVVNDGSTDDTAAILSGMLGLRVVQHGPNRGTAAAINTGIAAARESMPGVRWLTWVSSDNVHYPHWAQTLLDAAGDDVGVVYSGYDARGGIRPDHYNFMAYDPAWLGEKTACYIGPSFIVRADVWQEHEGGLAHDYANWLRVEEACWSKGLRIVGIDEPLCMYRMHVEQATRRNGAGVKDAPRWLHAAQLRRAAGRVKPPL